jgi:tetratricopeptide (TPR) repeat protein
MRLLLGGLALSLNLLPARYPREFPNFIGRFTQQQNPRAEQAKTEAEIPRLEAGKPIERLLTGGESHAYEIRLPANHFLHVVVEQRGIDVVVTLFEPDGDKLAEVDSPNGMQGREPAFILAETTGDYRLEVRSPEKNAAAGRYEIRVAELRQATEEDRMRVSAFKLFMEGDSLRSQQMKESLTSAIERFQEALSLWRKANDKAGEADTLDRLVRVYSSLSETRKALEYGFEELSLRRAIVDRVGEAVSLNNIGVRYFNLAEYQKAGEYFTQALTIHREKRNSLEEALTLSNLGAVYSILGEPQKALDFHHQALAIRRSLADRAGEAHTLGQLGGLHYQLGEYQKALDYHEQALFIYRESKKNRGGEAIALANIAADYAKLHERQKALDFWQQALPLMQAVGDHFNEIAILQSLGAAHSGRQALDYLEKALKRSREIDDRKNEAATLDSLGDTYTDLGELDQARHYLDQALALHRAGGRRDDEAYSLRAIAQVERDRGNLEESLARIEEALRIVESLRGNVAITDLRASYLSSKHQYYRLHIDVLMRLHQKHPTAGHEAAALHANERARARGLLELLAEARADIRADVDQEMLRHDRDLRRRLNDKASELAKLKGRKQMEDQAAPLEKEVDALRSEIQIAEAEIRRKSPRYMSLTRPRPLTLAEIQQQAWIPTANN